MAKLFCPSCRVEVDEADAAELYLGERKTVKACPKCETELVEKPPRTL